MTSKAYVILSNHVHDSRGRYFRDDDVRRRNEMDKTKYSNIMEH